ncbi:uncharacterized protein EI90DRAFT_3125811 [Cantharellus anzutake]|uniref:uncharacterized protein n=1 Tax=Cantharellus anzutake TaxID=1750568 RepID=UPI0019040CCA|nr:uncharacterized protein EI90DRAFT_3125811 [Cantharellus anzutake]KAF8328682.1 hypothetical protein EI90DRAFT_3125811 [Cantharellus anzutake]
MQAESKVNKLLWSLRSAQAPRRRPGAPISPYDSSLPAFLSAWDLDSFDPAALVTGPSSELPSGPKPPPSWERHRGNLNAHKHTPQWRKEALSLSMKEAQFEGGLLTDLIWDFDKSLAHPQRFPSLRHLCLLRFVASDLTTMYPSKYVSSLPPHIRLLIARYAAIFSPLGPRASKAVWGSDRHTLGEVILVGRSQTSRGIHWKDIEDISKTLFGDPSSGTILDTPDNWSWDDVDQSDMPFPSRRAEDDREPLTTLITLHMSLSDAFFTYLPHTLLHLSLISLSSTTTLPFRLLMRTLPLLHTFDISHNPDLMHFDQIAALPWQSKWKDMKMLGMRSCWASEEAKRCLKAINGKRPGRWIEVVLYPLLPT